MADNIWFRARTFGGWGWTPVTWQGWLVTIFFIGLFIATPAFVKKYFPNSDPKRGSIVLGLILVEVLLLVLVCYFTGDKPSLPGN